MHLIRKQLLISLIAIGSLLATHSGQAQTTQRTAVWSWAQRLMPVDTITRFSSYRLTSVIADGAGGAYVAGAFRENLQLGSTTLTCIYNTNAFVAHLDANKQWQWAVQAGTNADDEITDLVLSPTGSVWVSGRCSVPPGVEIAYFDTITHLFPRGGTYLFLGNLSATGHWQSVTFGGGGTVNGGLYGMGVGVGSAGEVVAAGQYAGDTIWLGNTSYLTPASKGIYVAEFSATGQPQHVTFASTAPLAFSSITDLAVAGGDVYITGGYRQRLTFNSSLQLSYPAPGAQDCGFVARFAPTQHQWVWARSLSNLATASTEYSQLLRVQADPQGHIYVAGSAAGRVDLGPAQLVLPIATGLVCRLDAATGAGQWLAMATGESIIRDIATTTDSVYVVCDGPGPVTLGSLALTSPAGSGVSALACLSQQSGSWEWVKQLPARATARILTRLSPADWFVGGEYGSGAVQFGSQQLAPTPWFTRSYFLGQISDRVTGLADEAAGGSFTLSPNPARSFVQLSGSGIAQVYDARGSLVRTTTTATLDVRGLPAGLYLVKRGASTRRLLVE